MLYRNMLRQQFDMVVLDIGLPDEDDLSVVQHLREISKLGICMLTGNTGQEDHIRALTNGADAFLSKPVNIEVLAATLHSVARRLTQTDATATPHGVAESGHWRRRCEELCRGAGAGQLRHALSLACGGAVISHRCDRGRLGWWLAESVSWPSPISFDGVHLVRSKAKPSPGEVPSSPGLFCCLVSCFTRSGFGAGSAPASQLQ
jgi:hypothetical protein